MLIVSKDFLYEKSKIIINFLEGKLKEQQIRDFIEFCMVGEEGLAFETLCEQIYEEDVNISYEVFELLKEKIVSYCVDFEYLNDIEHLVVGKVTP